MRGIWLPVLLATGCTEPVEGTFVGNPTLRARYVDNDTQVGLGGELVTLDTSVEPCSAETVSLGPQTFLFDGTEATIALELPRDELCGILVVVASLAITVADDGVDKTVIGQDFDLAVHSDAIPADTASLELRLGDDGWLPAFLPLAPAGTTTLNDQSDPELAAAFFDGLDAGSSFSAINITAAE